MRKKNSEDFENAKKLVRKSIKCGNHKGNAQKFG